MAKDQIKILQTNKKAYFNYEVVEDFECGVALQGTEVKSIRMSRFSFGDSYVKITAKGLVLVAMHISQYAHGSINNHEPERDRRLLVHKQEIKRMKRKVDEKGMTLVPTQVYLKGNLVKVRISLCRGKQEHDKRNTIKDRDMKRDLRRELKNFNR
ncbi:MAG TPA: SsrA-binding protein [Sphaerochaeta sp.]|jgi:SsrA-binding protein|nr:MAG: SsrA-binding protein [Spirochaetes bacterium GWC2_52_13]OHD68193.1 MAG: SsrA-binding protein [Spirochaetes bacterium GWF2_52_7]PKL20528.1 MAG: SsrA-binding protein [Spirochaetae bacterium HGW-Spirochaetae-4]HCG64201.1 SsrA-binding protein [Sphaerochaeta sp.]HCJ94200.1 SsrA-binding protein [Sphaerochaeta sp.]